VALIAEFMLNELILKNSDSLEKLDLKHLKELFSGEGDDEENEEEMEDEMQQVMAEMEADNESDKYSEPIQKQDQPPTKKEKTKNSEPRVKESGERKLNRSSNQKDLQNEKSLQQKSKSHKKDSEESSDDDDFRAMDIGALRKQQEMADAER